MNLTKPATRPPKWAALAHHIEPHSSGAAASNIADCDALADEAWGERTTWKPHAGPLAFAYLFRRFGPSPDGCDDYKELACYYLKTRMPGVYLWVSPRFSHCGTGFMVKPEIALQCDRESRPWNFAFSGWCRKHSLEYFDAIFDDKAKRRAEKEIGKFSDYAIPDVRDRKSLTGMLRKVSDALLEAHVELLRPVCVRDTAMNVLGPVGVGRPTCKYAEPSRFAGLGVPTEAMEALLKS